MNKATYQKRALLLTFILAALTICCLLWIVFSKPVEAELYADIYQNGNLLQSIPLSSVGENYTITIEGESGAINEIEVRHGSIGIISASCPDKLCVHQGFIDNSLLPITCLPNRLVIQIRQADDTTNHSKETITPDIITY